MELKQKDNYRVTCANFLSEDALRSLISFYQPLIGKEALCFYLTLYSESFSQKVLENHGRLSTLLNCSVDALERARIRCEEFLLIRTFCQEEDSKATYLYVLNAPLTVHEFLKNEEFMSLYAHALGDKQAQYSVTKFTQPGFSKGYQDITRPVVHGIKGKKFQAKTEIPVLTPRYTFSEDDTAINFDYDHFFATTSTLVFPAELRSQENLKLIGKLATVYGLSADKMRVIIGRSVSIAEGRLDIEKLKVLCAKASPDILQAKDPYSLSPVSFLQAKQNGAEVSMSDKKILERLSVKMHFRNEVINVMIEYILRVSENRLIPAFVDSVAGEWARDKVTTKEEAIKEAKKKVRSVPSGRKDQLPAYYELIKKGELPTGQTASKEEIEEVQKMMKEVGKKHGTN